MYGDWGIRGWVDRAKSTKTADIETVQQLLLLRTLFSNCVSTGWKPKSWKQKRVAGTSAGQKGIGGRLVGEMPSPSPFPPPPPPLPLPLLALLRVDASSSASRGALLLLLLAALIVTRIAPPPDASPATAASKPDVDGAGGRGRVRFPITVKTGLSVVVCEDDI